MREKNIKYYLAIFILFLSAKSYSQNDNSSIIEQKSRLESKQLSVEAGSMEEANNTIRSYLIDNFPLITDYTIERIISGRTTEIINKSETDKTSNFYKYIFNIPENYLADTAKILWELNIPEFRSNLYQLYKQDTIYLDTWNNVVGTNKDKTYAGYFEAFKIRNWPSWKDPEKGKEELPPTPPGPKNPLGLFAVHYDESSLRYFHGTNKPKLLNSKMRNLSHGCVRNENENILKMKEFIIKKVIKSKDLSLWLDSKKSMEYYLEKSERFPVRILYKTYNFSKDDTGPYVELYKDIYNYSNPKYLEDKFNDASLVFLSSKQNLVKEYRIKIGNDLNEDNLEKLINYILKNCGYYERYYLKDLIFQMN
ncbi:hypothetical protein D4R20_03480 [bacterium]|nr:MAG: hypothetical protein D4R20_03480 [bacterium]